MTVPRSFDQGQRRNAAIPPQQYREEDEYLQDQVQDGPTVQFDRPRVRRITAQECVLVERDEERPHDISDRRHQPYREVDFVQCGCEVADADIRLDPEVCTKVTEAEDDLVAGAKRPRSELGTGEHGDEVAEDGGADAVEEEDQEEVGEMVPNIQFTSLVIFNVLHTLQPCQEQGRKCESSHHSNGWRAVWTPPPPP